jgi:hypothetical protein
VFLGGVAVIQPNWLDSRNCEVTKRVLTQLALYRVGLRETIVIQQPLLSRFSGMKFFTTQGQKIEEWDMLSTILVKQ